ncbi:hypothetical protein NDA11_000350 [Ustilago hordei]|uniref:Uncharacterized protein n=1 Tax=Ustilago hordei TaxID=120017 RepID=I2G328_USTHO|nr:uncharacterized protein UHO2_02786 [Ustilago hordei]KAJ1040472.1 hypothetical protein NDA10_006351 [Ustilago hordei]KAJ1585316.1 hypothetical protein NDA15_005081 [Ustilago hordei]KAJ1587901.1 hypothetical protein NDA12_001769 [Ustilago hordei]KAJ1592655.1 hypothetical protein NDA11_000350 [Ustilago hordei]KAJ1601211.1 hypothetical protein NDA14_000206 [Ustilago hordei]
MGSVFSCLASTFMYLGEFVENAFLAVGEIGAVLSRALIGIVVSLCDFLAAISCCYRVPWSQRPDRSFFTYSSLTYSSQDNTQLATTNSSTLASVGGKQVLSSLLTKQGREQREEIKAARKKAAKVKAEKDAVVSITKKEEEAKKKTAAEEENKSAKEEKAKEEKAAAAVKA